MIANFTDYRLLRRGAVSPAVQHRVGVEVGDVDPGFETEYCDTISGEARAIGGGVVEAIFHSFQGLKNPAT